MCGEDARDATNEFIWVRPRRCCEDLDVQCKQGTPDRDEILQEILQQTVSVWAEVEHTSPHS